MTGILKWRSPKKTKKNYMIFYLDSHIPIVKCKIFRRVMLRFGGPGSSVGIVTEYGLDGPGIESRWGEIFRRPDRPWGPPSLLYNGYRFFPAGKMRPERDVDPSPPSSAEV